jgi:hypothetical protein
MGGKDSFAFESLSCRSFALSILHWAILHWAILHWDGGHFFRPLFFLRSEGGYCLDDRDGHDSEIGFTIRSA